MPADRLTRLTRLAPAPAHGIVHLGLGSFFRAHGAIYTEEAIAASAKPGTRDWGITGVSLQSSRMRDALAPQGGAYIALELAPEGEIARRVEVVREVLVAREDPGAVLALMADPSTRIVSLTVTEKGYCHEPATGALNHTHPDVIHDIAERLPVSAPGFLVRALQMRRAAGIAPFTVLSCDNLPSNGVVVRGVVLALAREIDPALADWIEVEGRFPSTMVDRIAPATKPEDIARVEALTGFHDAAPVVHEPFRQWVIEDRFVGDRPDWGAVGVELVDDVTPYEHMKLRMLNGTHSPLAYLGYLAGHETIADCMADPVVAAYVDGLWKNEIIPAVDAPPGVSLTDYAKALHERFSNPAIRHLTWQIAMDGSQKLPQRILGTVADGLAAGRSTPGLILAIAGWMHYVSGVDLNGAPIDVRDPLAERLKALSEAADTPEDKVAALLGVREIFPQDLAAQISAPVKAAYARLADEGVHKAMEAANR